MRYIFFFLAVTFFVSAQATAREDRTGDEELARMLASGVFGVSEETNPAPRVSAAHRAIQDWEGQAVSHRTDTTMDIGYMGESRTLQYPGYNFPKAPMLHPYHPHRDDTPEMWKETRVILHTSVNLKAQTDLFRDFLPEAAKASVSGIPSDNLDIFWIVQDNPWTASAKILFRPHYWAYPDAPAKAGHTRNFQVQAQILSSIPADIALAEKNFDVSIHPDGGGFLISSPKNAHIPRATRPDETFSFWSLTQANGRTAITLHWVLNDEDKSLMLETIGLSHNLIGLLEVFNRIVSFRGSEILQSHLLPELDEFLNFQQQFSI